MKERSNAFPVFCLLLGLAMGGTAGFASGQWRGIAITLQGNAPAPGIEPEYVSMNTALPVEHPRAKIVVGR